jgi:mono/diheme cytochrome c family protein
MKGSQRNSSSSPPFINGSILFLWATVAFLTAIVLVALTNSSENPPAASESISADIIRGEAIFNGEGCLECHSRMVRVQDRGAGALASDVSVSVCGYPGSSRIGPDLQNIAGRYPRSILEIRLTQPEALQPGTVMPSYSYLGTIRRLALIAYLERTALIPGNLDAVRVKNEIETSVPDEILLSLQKYIDSESGILLLPSMATLEFLNTGRGIYNSRCAACHGVEGRGDGPVTDHGLRTGMASPVVPASDFTSPEFISNSPVMLYWRIKEGVPGTSMPKWGGTLSEDAIWYLVGYIKSFSETGEVETEIEVEPLDLGWVESPFSLSAGLFDFGAPLSVWQDEMAASAGQVDEIVIESDTNESDVSINRDNDSGAPEEEGYVGEDDGNSSDASESANDMTAGEVSP